MVAVPKPLDIEYAIETIPRETVLWRVFAQKPSAPDRTVAFNPNSNGRVSPVLSGGAPMPVMYVSIDSAQGAIREYLYHFTVRKNPPKSYLPLSNFANVMVAKLRVIRPLRIVSVQRLALNNFPNAAEFSKETLDYTLTRNLAQTAFDVHDKVSGLTWQSARPPSGSVNAALYEPRVPVKTFEVLLSATAICSLSEHWNYAQAYLEQHEIAIDF
jgi:hypothetical protein